MLKTKMIKTQMMILVAATALGATSALAQVAGTGGLYLGGMPYAGGIPYAGGVPSAGGVPYTGIGPAPTGIMPGGVVPVPGPAFSTTPTPELTPPYQVLSAPIGVNPVPAFPGERPNGTATLNTFSEQQVRSNLMAQGYSAISGLTIDGAGTWYGTAVRDGGNVAVTVDSNGMVTPR
jgi:hypothetical protein